MGRVTEPVHAVAVIEREEVKRWRLRSPVMPGI